MHGRLLGARGPAVDADVLGDRLLGRVGAHALVGGDQPAGAFGARLGVDRFALAAGLVAHAVPGGSGHVGHLLGEPLVQGLAVVLLGRRGAVLGHAQGFLRRGVALVERLVVGPLVDGVLEVEGRGVLLLLVVPGGLVGVVGHRVRAHRCLPLALRRLGGLGVRFAFPVTRSLTRSGRVVFTRAARRARSDR
ncbi:hypothetical protein AUW26_01690 [Streptomyces sp. CC71]|nr:hypothetical protein AUW26_01690 [Streptomyces sp. CC71]